MEAEVVPKYLIGTGEIGFHIHFGELKRACWSQRRLHKSSSCYVELLYSPFGPRITANLYLACKVHLTVRITSLAVRNL